jgi:hypothetical protein
MVKARKIRGPIKVYVIPTLIDAMGVCEECGAIEELRPYGKGGKKVCFDCAMKNEKEALKQFKNNFK